jgi:hypothetical protein
MKKALLILFVYPDRVVVKTYDHRQGLWLDRLERKTSPGSMRNRKRVMIIMNIFPLTTGLYKTKVRNYRLGLTRKTQVCMIYTGNRHCFSHGIISLLPPGQPVAQQRFPVHFPISLRIPKLKPFCPHHMGCGYSGNSCPVKPLSRLHGNAWHVRAASAGRIGGDQRDYPRKTDSTQSSFF